MKISEKLQLLLKKLYPDFEVFLPSRYKRVIISRDLSWIASAEMKLGEKEILEICFFGLNNMDECVKYGIYSKPRELRKAQKYELDDIKYSRIDEYICANKPL